MFIMMEYSKSFRKNQADEKDPASHSNPVYNCSELTDITNTASVPSAEYAKPNKTGIYKVPPTTKEQGRGLPTQECDTVFVDNDIYNDTDREEKTTQDGMVDNELYDTGPPNADNEPHVPDTSAVYLNLGKSLAAAKEGYTGLHFTANTTTATDEIEFKENDVYESASMSSDQDKSGDDFKHESVTDMLENDVYSQ